MDGDVVKKIFKTTTKPENSEKEKEDQDVSATTDVEKEAEIDSEAETESEEKHHDVTITNNQYCLVSNGKSSLPAVITCTSPLAVRYFEEGPPGLYRAAEYTQEIIASDIAKTLCGPQLVARGTRLFYNFEGCC